MTKVPVTRESLAQYQLPNIFALKNIEVRRISMVENLVAGSHRHNGPVFGVIEKGSAFVQVGDGEVQRLSAGDIFYEPQEDVIKKFDATEEGVTFLAWFPLENQTKPEIEML
jgi:quercetin dioxygenase-like cupin family protein